MNDLIEVAVVAKRLNVSASTVYRLITAGKLEAINVGVSKGIRVTRESLDNFLGRRHKNSR